MPRSRTARKLRALLHDEIETLRERAESLRARGGTLRDTLDDAGEVGERLVRAAARAGARSGVRRARHTVEQAWDGRRMRTLVVEAGRTPTALGAAGFVGGLLVGAVAWSQLLDRSRNGLFSPHPVRRFAAVSYLGARPSVDTVRLLRDYVRWEPHPLLRRRARRVLRAVEASLEA